MALAMRSQAAVRRTIALVVVVTMLGLSLAALGALSGGDGERERAAGLAGRFDAVDNAYQAQTQEFVRETKDVKDPDLRTSLRLYGLVLDAANDAQDGYAELAVLDGMEDTRDRVVKALEVQILALEKAVAAVRDQNTAGANAATREFQAAALAYQAARARLRAAIEQCGARCA